MSIFSSKSQYNKVKTDSRKFREGEIFIALKGENFDGHDFLNQVLEKNPELIFSEKNHPDPRVKVVKDSLKTYQELANEYRNLLDPIVIGITGSSGKTTLKELLTKILETKFKVHATEANFNNEIGVPKTILSMPEDTEILILEMGMRGLGEIELLSKIAEPNIAVITNIGTAHIERLGSKDNIKKAKLEILEGIRKWGVGNKGKLIVNSKLYESLQGKYQNLDLIPFSPDPISCSLPPNYLISNGLLASINAAIKIAELLNLTQEQIQQGLVNYQPGPGRGEFIYKDGNLFIDESYNSNPEAVRNSVYAMLKQFPNDHKIALLGDIKESQDQLIKELFEELAELKGLTLLDARSMNTNQAKELLEANLKANQKNIVLLKASRAAKFENILASGFKPPASNPVNTTH